MSRYEHYLRHILVDKESKLLVKQIWLVTFGIIILAELPIMIFYVVPTIFNIDIMDTLTIISSAWALLIMSFWLMVYVWKSYNGYEDQIDEIIRVLK